MASLFCRHNRFTADCPICSKGTVLDPATGRRSRRAPGQSTPSRAAGGRRERAVRPPASGGGEFRGPYAAAGPYERDGERYEVRLERVPGGLRLGEWSGGSLSRRAPVLAGAHLRELIDAAAERKVARPRDLAALAGALGPSAGPGAAGERAADSLARRAGPAPPGERGYGASRGRAGELQEELRVEPLGEGRVRVGRWVHRPGSGWRLQEAPTMFPAGRYAEAIADAARRGLIPAGERSRAAGER